MIHPRKGSTLLIQPGKPWFHARGFFCDDVWGLERYCLVEILSSIAVVVFEQCVDCKGRVAIEMFC